MRRFVAVGVTDVAAAHLAAGVAVDERPYRPHLTPRRGRDLDPAPLAGYAGPSWIVDGFDLLESRSGRYVRRARYPAAVTAATTCG